ncbi:MAG: transposase [Nitrospirota bacterium]
MERLRYDEDFKSEAVRLIKEGGRKVSEGSRNLGIHENLLYKWKKSLTDIASKYGKVSRTKGFSYRLLVNIDILLNRSCF